MVLGSGNFLIYCCIFDKKNDPSNLVDPEYITITNFSGDIHLENYSDYEHDSYIAFV